MPAPDKAHLLSSLGALQGGAVIIMFPNSMIRRKDREVK